MASLHPLRTFGAVASLHPLRTFGADMEQLLPAQPVLSLVAFSMPEHCGAYMSTQGIVPLDTDLFFHPSKQRLSSCAIQNMSLVAEVPNSALSNNVVHDGASASFNHGQYLHKRESDTRRLCKTCRYDKNANHHLFLNSVERSMVQLDILSWRMHCMSIHLSLPLSRLRSAATILVATQDVSSSPNS